MRGSKNFHPYQAPSTDCDYLNTLLNYSMNYLPGICSITRDVNSLVYGVVYWVDDGVFGALDEHEGPTYSRIKLKVKT